MLNEIPVFGTNSEPAERYERSRRVLTNPITEGSKMAKANRICSIADCGKPTYARDVCKNHYRRVRKYGDALGGPRTAYRVAQTYFYDVVIPYPGDECLFWPFARSANGYGSLHWHGREEGTHRLACMFAHGPAPEGRNYAAHSCGNGHLGCVNPRHLRWATQKENMLDKIAARTIRKT